MEPYAGILDGSGDVWGVRIPDLPGCHGSGTSPEAAIADAASAARAWAEHIIGKGYDVPAARPLTQIVAASGETVVMVPMLRDDRCKSRRFRGT